MALRILHPEKNFKYEFEIKIFHQTKDKKREKSKQVDHFISGPKQKEI